VAASYEPGREPEESSRPPRRRSPSEEVLLAEADALGVPWARLLEAEIAAERDLRQSEVTIEHADDLPLALCVLSRTALASWRVRERVDELCGAAAVAGSQAPLRRLLRFVRGLAGGASPERALVAARRAHCRLAYRRIRRLVVLLRSAGRPESASFGERARRLIERTGCSLPDAEWAVARAASPDFRGHLEEAVVRAREEGFQLPVAGSDRAAYRMLRGWIAASAAAPRRRPPGPRRPGRAPRPSGIPSRADGTLDRDSDS
jgi:hypothetical protein